MFIHSKVIKRQSQGKYHIPYHIHLPRFCLALGPNRLTGWLAGCVGGSEWGSSAGGSSRGDYLNLSTREGLPLLTFSFCFPFCASLINASVNKTEVITLSLSPSLSLSLSSLFLSLSNACILAINRICWQAKKSLNFGSKFNMRNAQEFCIHCSWFKIYETSWRINHMGMPYDQEYITIYSMWSKISIAFLIVSSSYSLDCKENIIISARNPWLVPIDIW